MFENVGVAPSSGIGCAMVFVGSVVPTVILQWRGATWRRNAEE